MVRASILESLFGVSSQLYVGATPSDHRSAEGGPHQRPHSSLSRAKVVQQILRE